MNVANLYTIADLDNMQVIGNVDEADIGQVKMGQAVTFSVDAYPNDLFHGQVTQVRLNPTTESNVVTYEVVVAAPNHDHKLIPGLTANLTIYVMQEENILLLPSQAFAFEPNMPDGDSGLPQPISRPDKSALEANEKIVWVLGQDDTLTPKVVKIGASNGIKTQILEGISESEKVVTDYNMIADTQDKPDGERSPFAPQPPGSKKKK